MKLKQEEVQRVCRLVLERLKEKQLVVLKEAEDVVYKAMLQAFMKNLQDEEAIDVAAQKILEQNLEANPDVDQYKMLLLIKRKIAKDKGFVL